MAGNIRCFLVVVLFLVFVFCCCCCCRCCCWLLICSCCCCFVCVRACVRVCVRACVRACVCVCCFMFVCLFVFNVRTNVDSTAREQVPRTPEESLHWKLTQAAKFRWTHERWSRCGVYSKMSCQGTIILHSDKRTVNSFEGYERKKKVAKTHSQLQRSVCVVVSSHCPGRICPQIEGTSGRQILMTSEIPQYVDD